MSNSLSDMQQLRTVLGRLDAERPATSGADEDRMPYIDREDDFQRRLELELASRRRKARLLISGQIGEDKSDLVRALLVLRASFSSFPENLILLPTADAELQKFSIQLFEGDDLEHLTAPRVFLVPQATTECLGAWLNGWR